MLWCSLETPWWGASTRYPQHIFMPPHLMMPGAYSFLVFSMCIRGYVRTNVRPSVRMCVRMYIHTYVHDPIRLRLRHLYQVEFCSFIVRYPTAWLSVYCGHISSLWRNKKNFVDTPSYLELWNNFCVYENLNLLTYLSYNLTWAQLFKALLA